MSKEIKKMETIKKKKVCIMGFAPSWEETPFGDKDFEIWTLNEAYRLLATKQIPVDRIDKWFEIHSRNSPSKNNPEHIKFLQNANMPVYMWDKYEDMPNSLPFPRDEIIKWFADRGHSGHRYFTNSISWMIALAITQGYDEIWVTGVDMAQDSEYASQKPSCEYFLGIAEGMGIKMHIPETSDLLKCGLLYGFESDNGLRVKMKARQKELKQRRKQFLAEIQKFTAQIKQHEANIYNIDGAVNDIDFWLKNWTV